MKNLLKPLAKSVLISLGLTAATSATDAAIHKKMFGSDTRTSELAKQTALITCNEEMSDMEIVESFDESGLLIKGVSEAIQNKVKQQKGIFLSILLGTLAASLLENLLTGKVTIRAGEGSITAAQDF